MREFIIFLRHLWLLLSFVRGVLFSLIALLAIFAVITAQIEGISLGDAFYMICITALTVGYGDITPTTPVTRVLGVLAGLVGVIFVGLVVAVSTRALQKAVDEEARSRNEKPGWDE